MGETVTLESIRRLDIRPGEILVATVPDDTTERDLQLIGDRLRQRLPDGVEILVVTQVEFHVLSAEAAQRAAATA